ncbi:hypothetical protein ACFLQN_04335 [Candidatus Aenigmatarchaeota archaeon]
MSIRENLRKAMRSDVGRALLITTAAGTITLAGWAGLTYAHSMHHGAYEGSAASGMLDKARSSNNVAKKALALGLYPLTLAQDGANELYKSLNSD